MAASCRQYWKKTETTWQVLLALKDKTVRIKDAKNATFTKYYHEGQWTGKILFYYSTTPSNILQYYARDQPFVHVSTASIQVIVFESYKNYYPRSNAATTIYPVQRPKMSSMGKKLSDIF